MRKTINPDDDTIDIYEDYFRKKNFFEEESEEYFPLEDSRPPHY